MVRKFVSELIGTCLLVVFGCGTAVLVSKYLTKLGAPTSYAYLYHGLIIALAFGLILMALAYTIGKVSGAHVNPAVSIAALIDGRISVFDCVYYVFAQVLGGLVGAFVLTWIFGKDNLGANGFGKLSLLGEAAFKNWVLVALVIEAILTFVFVLVVLSVTKKDSDTNGLVVGLALTLVHIFGIPFTGTSVNPARSIGPALITQGEALKQLWVFIVGPLVGGILAALFYRYVIAYVKKEVVYEVVEEVVVEEPKKTRKVTTKKTTRKVK
jgi:aquaporin Z